MSGQSGQSGQSTHKKGNINWFQLALLGLGFTTGTGFFLGSAIAIEYSGYSVLLLFVIASIGTYFVYDSLARMIAQESLSGSFRSYSKKAFGHWAGFAHGWIYWSSEILILGSQLMGLGLFTQYWFPNLQLWILAGGYAIAGILIVLLGTKGFEKTENILAVVKLSSIAIFIALAFLVFAEIFGGDIAHTHRPTGVGDFFTHGPMGLWTGLVYVFFAFAGIEVMGLIATHLKNPKDAPKAGRLMIPIIAVLFILSISVALLMAPLDAFTPEESPFLTALQDIRFTRLVHIFNGILIVAGFSSLVASLYSVTQMVYTIAKEGDAPRFFDEKGARGIPYHSLTLTLGGMIASIVTALLLPKEVYEYITTAGGLMLLYTWFMIVLSARKNLKLSFWGHIKTLTAAGLILIAAAGTLFDHKSRPGFFASLALLAIILTVTLVMRKKWKKEGGDGGGGGQGGNEEKEPLELFIPKKEALRLGGRSKARSQ